MTTGEDRDKHARVKGPAWEELRRGGAQFGSGLMNLVNSVPFLRFDWLLAERWFQPLYLLGSLLLALLLLVRLLQGRLVVALLLLVGLLSYRLLFEALAMLLALYRRISGIDGE